MTTPDEARALVRRLLESFNTRRFDEVDDLCTPGYVNHPLGATGTAAGKAACRAVVARFPAMQVVAEDVLVDGDRVAVRSTVVGMGAARPQLIEIFRIDGGRLAETWGVTEGPDPR